MERNYYKKYIRVPNKKKIGERQAMICRLTSTNLYCIDAGIDTGPMGGYRNFDKNSFIATSAQLFWLFLLVQV